jgi:uncharacterized protein YcbK (DUF882 family)
VIKGWPQLTKNFHLSELMCRDGTPVPDEYVDNARLICERAQALRDIAGPLVVVSGYRSLAHNKRVNGAKSSQHLTASALDLRSAKVSAADLHRLYLRLIRDRLVPDGGLGLYRTWVHVDLGRPRRWKG